MCIFNGLNNQYTINKITNFGTSKSFTSHNTLNAKLYKDQLQRNKEQGLTDHRIEASTKAHVVPTQVLANSCSINASTYRSVKFCYGGESKLIFA